MTAPVAEPPVAELLVAALAVTLLATLRFRPGPDLRGSTPAAAETPTPARLRRRRSPGPAELAAWCDALAGDVRAGSTLAAALRAHEPPGGSRLATVGVRLRRGHPVAEAVADAARTDDERAIATVLAAIARHGGEAAQPLDRVAATLRRRAADHAERHAQSAQARLSALVMTLLPGAVLLLLLATSPSVRATTTTPVGAGVVVLGAALNAAGWWWMRRLIRAGGRG